jgi:hypothetical protein
MAYLNPQAAKLFRHADNVSLMKGVYRELIDTSRSGVAGNVRFTSVSDRIAESQRRAEQGFDRVGCLGHPRHGNCALGESHGRGRPLLVAPALRLGADGGRITCPTDGLRKTNTSV